MTTTTTCERQVCALTDTNERVMRPCIREVGHDGVCRYAAEGTTAPKKARRKVVHLFWVRDLEAARPLGLACVSICGRKAERPMPKPNQMKVEVVGNLVPLFDDETSNCVMCQRAYSRFCLEANR